MNAPCGSVPDGHFLGSLILLRGRKNKRGIVSALGWSRAWLAVGQRVWRFIDVARIEGQSALAVNRADAAADAARVTTVEDDRQVNALVESGVEDARHLAVADVEPALVGVRGNQGAVGVDILIAGKHGELVALAVNAQRAVAGIIKDYGVAFLRKVDKILLHRGKNAVVRGLVGGKEGDARAWMRAAPGW